MTDKNRKKRSNIIIVLLAVIIVGCGVMAIGTFNGWFSSDETAAEEQMVTEENSESSDANGSSDSDSTASEEDIEAAEDSGTASSTCTICIKCTSVLKNMDKLKSGKEKCVPSNGIILSTSRVEICEGQTVYDVLKGSCSAAGIPMSARNSSMGTYVEGINGLFEFDCGGKSGWMYSVNGTAPNHSSSAHKVKNGDSIVWYYTCGN